MTATLTNDLRFLMSQAVEKVKTKAAKDIKKKPALAAEFLAALKEERDLYTESNKTTMQNIVDVLVAAGIYPAKPKHGTPLSMVESYGVDWYEWKGILNCPHCKADFRDHVAGPPFKRHMGIEVRGLYDGVAYNQCPDCKGFFSRKGTALTEDQVRHIRREEIFTL